MPRVSNRTADLREQVKTWARGRWALPIAALLGFLENTIILFAMEPLFLPIMISRGRRAWTVAAALLLGNVLGGVAMYSLGYWLAEPLIEPLIQSAGLQDLYETNMEDLEENGFIAIFLVGVTFIPFQVGAAAAGATAYSFPLFLVAITISRAIRYFALAALVWAVGSRAEDVFEAHELEIYLVGLAVFVGLIVFAFLA